jgi:hypothetical protein
LDVSPFAELLVRDYLREKGCHNTLAAFDDENARLHPNDETDLVETWVRNP